VEETDLGLDRWLAGPAIVVLDQYGVAYFDGHSDFRHPGNALALVTGRGPDLDPDAPGHRAHQHPGSCP
jgi:hypothetical protein